jgi:hypothetical protein
MNFLRMLLPGFAALLLAAPGPAPGGTVKVYPAPAGEELSKDFAVKVEGKDVPVYAAKVAPRDPARRWKAMDDKKNSADYFEMASLAYFDMQGAVKVAVTCPEEVKEARVLPTSAKIVPAVQGKGVTFTVPEPRNLVLEVNGNWVNSLQIFANPMEAGAPAPNDPNVIYYGPGVHEVTRVVVGDGKTVYVAGGAVVRAVIGPDEKFSISGYSGLKNYAPTFELRGKNIAFRGRGIVDAGRCTTHARHPLYVQGQDITLEGVILRDSSTWTVPIRRSDRVTVKNVKLMGYRANSDGIDICNSRDVTVDGCFIRTLDDLIVVKSDKGQGEVRRIVAKGCVLWNEVAHAVSVGAELRDPVEDVLFKDCDVVRDKGREWSMRVYHCDSAPVRNIRFEDLRIEESQRLISLWIGKAVWTRDEERGQIRNVLFRNIRAAAEKPLVELKGFDEAHAVEDVSFENVVINGKPLAAAGVKSNDFVKKVVVKP